MSDLRHRAQMYYAQLGSFPIVAPVDFNPDAQELNIINEFVYYTNDYKRLIFSVSSTSTTTVLANISTINGSGYVWREFVNGNMQSNSMVSTGGTITWTSGSTGRHVYVLSTGQLQQFTIPATVLWVYIGNFCSGISHSAASNTLKYIHCSTTVNVTLFGFNGVTSLTGVLSFPQGFLATTYNMFVNCTGLTGLSLPNSITSIADNSFRGCTNITGNIIISDNVTTMNNGASYGAFQGMTGLNNIVRLSANVATVPYYCFNGCSNIKTLIIPEGVQNISSSSFLSCTSLTSISLPSTMISIGINAFAFCSATRGNLILGVNLTTLSYYAFRSCGFDGALTILNPNMSMDVTGSNNAFYGCSSFTALNLPVGYVGNGAGGKTFNFSNNFSADSLNQSILNLIDNFGTLTIGTTNKNRLTAAYPNAVTNAAARGITIV